MNKKLEAPVRLLWQDVDGNEPCQVTLGRELASALEGHDLQVLLGGGNHYIQVSPEALTKLNGQYGAFSIQVSKVQDRTYAVSFLDEEGEVIEQIGEAVTVALPASGPLNTVMVSYTNGSDNWGGQYDAVTGTLSFETRYSGQYEVLENDIDISDIGDLDSDTQEAIKFLASKGYMGLIDGQFQPEKALNRYDFSQALVGMFFELDRGLTASFPDVPADSPYYAHVASGESNNLITGFPDGTFGGEQHITVEQMLAIAARSLVEKKGYLVPENADSYLTSFSDADQIAGWAKELVAQTVRDGIMDRADMLNPKGDVTRAQTALVLYRLFLLLYEVPPVALEVPPAALEVPPAALEVPPAALELPPAALELPPAVLPEEIPETEEQQTGSIVAPVLAGIAVCGGAGEAGWYFWKKKKGAKKA